MTGFSEPHKGFWVTIGVTLNKYWHLLAQSCGGIALGLSLTFFPDFYKLPINVEAPKQPSEAQQKVGVGGLEKPATMLSWPWLLVPLGVVGGACFTVFGTIASARDTNKLSRKVEALATKESEIVHLKEEMKELSYAGYQLVNELFNAYKAQTALWLTMASQELGFSERHRITIYRVDKERNVFAPLHRYSKGPKLNESGRKEFPIDKCAISLAYQSGSFFCNDIPNPTSDRQAYLEYLKQNFGYNQAVVGNLSMNSRSIAGFSILDERGTHYVGVVLFESLDTDLDEEQLKKLYNREQRRVLNFIQEAQQRGKSLERLRDQHLAKEGEGENERKIA